MTRKIPGDEELPAFMWLRNRKPLPYTYSDWLSKLREVLTKIGRRASLFSTHSFHRGGATYAFKVGVPVEVIKLLGDWKSDAFQQYLFIPKQKKREAAWRMASSLKKQSV